MNIKYKNTHNNFLPQVPRRTFPRRTKPPSPSSTSQTPDADATEVETTTINTESTTKFRRGGSKFKSRKEVESARNETRVENRGRRPSLNTTVKRNERPATRNYARRRPVGGNGTTTTVSPVVSSSTPSVTRRPFRVASRRRPSSTTTTLAPVTTSQSQPTTLLLESEESLQDIGDIDAIEDPTLEPRVPTSKVPKVQRRPLVNLKEDLKDQNPSATNEDETKRQSKKYSASFKQNQLDGLLKRKGDSLSTTENGSTLDDYNAETVLAIATHKLITAPLPISTDYDEDTKPTRTKTTQGYTTTYTDTKTPTEDYNTATYKVNPTEFVQTTIGDAINIYDTTKLTTYDDVKTTDFTVNTARPFDFTRTTAADIDAGKVYTGFPTAPRSTGYTNTPTEFDKVSPTFEVPKRTTVSRYPANQVFSTPNVGYSTQNIGYTTQNAGYITENAGYSTPNAVYTSTNAGFTTQTAGYSTANSYSSPKPTTPNEVTSYPAVVRGNAKYATSAGDNYPGYSQGQVTPESREPSYFTRDYLLESPVTKTFDEEYQYISSTTPQTPIRKVFRKKIQRRISTTLRPTTPTYVPTTPAPAPRAVARRPFEKVAKNEPNRTSKPVVSYDYYDDNAERVALKYAEGTKVILHGKGSIECLDVGNFPHPSSCKKFISCARMEFGSLLGWEYICPKGLSFDPVGGICNWSAGLGCDEKDI